METANTEIESGTDEGHGYAADIGPDTGFSTRWL